MSPTNFISIIDKERVWVEKKRNKVDLIHRSGSKGPTFSHSLGVETGGWKVRIVSPPVELVEKINMESK